VRLGFTPGGLERACPQGLQRNHMPALFQGHALTHDATKNQKGMIFGVHTKTFCGCGKAICSSAVGVTCSAFVCADESSGQCTHKFCVQTHLQWVVNIGVFQLFGSA
jgi:hypothetical protein